jgi:hypothetical protein
MLMRWGRAAFAGIGLGEVEPHPAGFPWFSGELKSKPSFADTFGHRSREDACLTDIGEIEIVESFFSVGGCQALFACFTGCPLAAGWREANREAAR